MDTLKEVSIKSIVDAVTAGDMTVDVMYGVAYLSGPSDECGEYDANQALRLLRDATEAGRHVLGGRSARRSYAGGVGGAAA